MGINWLVGNFLLSGYFFICDFRTMESILSGTEQLRLGFVSRYNSRDRNKHTILASTFFKPHELAAQMNLSIPNGWGVVKTISDLCFNKLGDGKYVLMKDPNKVFIIYYFFELILF